MDKYPRLTPLISNEILCPEDGVELDNMNSCETDRLLGIKQTTPTNSVNFSYSNKKSNSQPSQKFEQVPATVQKFEQVPATVQKFEQVPITVPSISVPTINPPQSPIVPYQYQNFPTVPASLQTNAFNNQPQYFVAPTPQSTSFNNLQQQYYPYSQPFFPNSFYQQNQPPQTTSMNNSYYPTLPNAPAMSYSNYGQTQQMSTSQRNFWNVPTKSANLKNIKVIEDELTNMLKKHGYDYIQINGETAKRQLHDLFINNNELVLSGPTTDTMLCLYYGIYFHIQGKIETMIQYLMEAVNHGSEIAMYNLACYYRDIGDSELMKTYFKMAIDYGCIQAMVNLGHYYFTVQEFDNMKTYYQMAIDMDKKHNIQEFGKLVVNGIAAAYTNMGYYFYITKKYKEMELNYQRAIQLKNVEASYYFGLYYSDISGNNKSAKQHFQDAADQGHVDSMFELAICHYNEKDYGTAEFYYSMAAENGHVDAMNNLGMHYMRNNDIASMKKYLMKAIELGHSTAMLNMGYYYETIKDWNNMLIYYNMAMDNGNKSVFFKLSNYYKTIKDFENMKKYLLLGAKYNKKKCIKLINEFVSGSENIMNIIPFALDSLDWLNKGNLAIVNEVIAYYHVIEAAIAKKKSRNEIIYNLNTCYNCATEGYVLYSGCNHLVCIKCFLDTKSCTKCN